MWAIGRLPVLCVRNQQQNGAWLIVSSQVVEVWFLEENGDFRCILVARVAENHDGSVHLCPQPRPPGLVFGARLTEASLRGTRNRKDRQQEENAAKKRVAGL